MRLTTFLAAAALAAPPLAAQPAAVGTTIDRAVATYERARTARATFEQTITNPLTGSTVRSRGVFHQEHGGRFAFVFTDPRGDRIVADGQAIWVFVPSTQPSQVIRIPAVSRGGGGFDLGAQFFSAPRSRFTITDGGAATIDGRATHVLRLVPKQGTNAGFTTGRVWIDDDDGTLRQFEVEEPSGVTRTVRFSDIVVNRKSEPGIFEFTPPRGVRIVEQRAFTGAP